MITHQTNPMKTAGVAAAAPANPQTSAGAGAPSPADVAPLQIDPLQCQLEAARFATQIEERLEQAAHVRANGHAEAIAHLVDGRPQRALSVVRETWMQQIRTLGMSYAAVTGLPYAEGGPLPGREPR